MYINQHRTLDFTDQRIDVRLDVLKRSWKVVYYTDNGFYNRA